MASHWGNTLDQRRTRGHLEVVEAKARCDGAALQHGTPPWDAPPFRGHLHDAASVAARDLSFSATRAPHHGRGVKANAIVETIDVFCKQDLCDAKRSDGLTDRKLGLYAGEEALRDCVVPAITAAAHALAGAHRGQRLAVVVAGVGASAIAVHDDSAARTASLAGFCERIEGEVPVVRRTR